MEPKSARLGLKIGRTPCYRNRGLMHYFFDNKFLIFFFTSGMPSLMNGLGILNASKILRTGGGVWFNPIPSGLCFPITCNSSFFDFISDSPVVLTFYDGYPTIKGVFEIGFICGIPGIFLQSYGISSATYCQRFRDIHHKNL